MHKYAQKMESKKKAVITVVFLTLISSFSEGLEDRNIKSTGETKRMCSNNTIKMPTCSVIVSQSFKRDILSKKTGCQTVKCLCFNQRWHPSSTT